MKDVVKFRTQMTIAIISIVAAMITGAAIFYAGCHYMQFLSKDQAQAEVQEKTTRAKIEDTKVTAKGSIPEGYSLKLVQQGSEDENTLKAKRLMDSKTTVIGAYDISMR